jgi:hypothetical protein
LRKEFHLTEYDFTAKVLELRRESRWIGDHVPSSSALVHVTQVSEAFAAHLFRGAGIPRIPHPWENRVLQGYVRDHGRGEASPAEIERAAAKDRQPPRARSASWTGVSLRMDAPGALVVHVHPSRDRNRNLMVPATAQAEPRSEREAWYLDDPDTWHQVKIVRREVRHHFVYEAHLLCAKAPYRDPARYANTPQGIVGVDLGVSTLAAVGFDANDRVMGSILVRPSSAEADRRQVAARKHRRVQRALERSRRSTNPEAYGPDGHGRRAEVLVSRARG